MSASLLKGYPAGTALRRYGLPVHPNTYVDNGNDTKIYPKSISVIQALASIYAPMSIYSDLSDTEKEWLESQTLKVKEFLCDYTVAACLGEARWAPIESSLSYGIKSSNYNSLFPQPFTIPYPNESKLALFFHSRFSCGRPGTRSGMARLLWVTFRKARFTRRQVLRLCEELFTTIHWTSSYGGPRWGHIASLGVELDTVSTPLEAMLAIDKLVHASHAGNYFMSSSKLGWAHMGVLKSEIQRFLNFKKRASACCFIKNLPNKLTEILPDTIIAKLKLYKPVHTGCFYLTDLSCETSSYAAADRYVERAKKKRINMERGLILKEIQCRNSKSGTSSPTKKGTEEDPIHLIGEEEE